MNKYLKEIKEKIIRSPLFRTMFFSVSVIMSGILCSTFVAEIFVDGKLNPALFYKTTSFYLIIIYIIILYFYNRFLYRAEKNMMNFLDDNYCTAYIINACLPDIIDKYKNDLKTGRNPAELIDIQSELNRLKNKN